MPPAPLPSRKKEMKTEKNRKSEPSVEEGRRASGRAIPSGHDLRQNRVLKIVLLTAAVGGIVLYASEMVASSPRKASSPHTHDILRILAALGTAKEGRQGEKQEETLALLEKKVQEVLQGSRASPTVGSSFGDKLVECQKELTSCRAGETEVDTNMVIQRLKKDKEALEALLKANCSDAADMEKLISGLKIEKELLQNQLKSALEGAGGGGRGGGISSNGALEKEVASLRAEKELLQAQLKIAQGGEPGEGAEIRGSSKEVSLDRVAELTDENAELKKQIEKLQREVKQAKDDANTDVSDVLKLQNRILELQAKIGEMKQKSPAGQQNCSAEVSQLQSKLKELEAKDNAGPQGLKTKIDELEWALSEAKKAPPLCNSTAGGLSSNSSSTQDLEEMKKKLEDMEVLHERVMTEKRQLTQKLADLSNSTTSGISVDSDRALEAAKKAIAECGAKPASPVQPAGSKLYDCQATDDELKQYLNYKPREQCPDDWLFIQNLIYVKNCFCLPRRRCFAPMPPSYVEPTIPFPQSLFEPKVLRNENVRWSKQYWPNYEAITSRKLGDCRDCFNLTLESQRWTKNLRGTITLDTFLALKNKGNLKIGLDVGGGTGSFAAKMAQHDITIVTTAMNTETLGDKEGGLPYMETIAQRGLIPLFVPHKARQPFFDGTLDLIHAINTIKYFSIQEFEELLFEWDRVLRPGGVIWFELFYTTVEEMPLYIAVLDIFKYKKLYWKLAPKTDAPEREGEHVYLNCVLEKPRLSSVLGKS